MDQKRLLIATALSMGILIGWQVLFPPAEPPADVQSAPESSDAGVSRPIDTSLYDNDTDVEPRSGTMSAGTVEEAAEAGIDSASGSSLDPELYESADREATFVLSNDVFSATFTNRGAQLLHFELLSQLTPEGQPIDLVRARSEPPYPFGITAPSGKPLDITEALFVGERSTAGNGLGSLEFRYSGPEGTAVKRFGLRDDGLIDVEITFDSPSPWSLAIGPGVQNPTGDEVLNRFAARELVYRHSGKVERIDARKAEEREIVTGEDISWVGLQDNYFLTTFLPQSGLVEFGALPRVVSRVGTSNRVERFDPENEAKDSEEVSRELLLSLRPEGATLSGTFYLGAKSYDRLSSLPGGLENTIDFGFFSFIAKPLLFALLWIHDNLVGNYGWAIIILTALIKILLFPLTHKSQVSMQKMQELNPKIQAIRAKYKSKLKDKQGRPNVDAQRKMNQEVMGLYSSEGVNPAGGCFPMLLQLPVFFAFYSVLGSAGELRGAPWIFWILDLSAKDPYYILPIVMGVSQFVQQRITPMGGDPMQRRMMQLLPIFFTFIFLGFASGLVLYWLTNNILTAIQMLVYRRYKNRAAAAQT